MKYLKYIVAIFSFVIVFINVYDNSKRDDKIEVLARTENIRIVKNVNINTGSIEELDRLEGVSEKLASRIIEYRDINKFEKPEDLMNVKGIGPKVFEKNKNIIAVK